MGSVEWPTLLRDFQAAVLPQAVASFKYYRDVSFAAALCGECSDAEAADANSANAAHYAAACKTLHKVVACEGSPSSADNLSNLLAQARLAVPRIEFAAQSAATADKDYSKAAELQSMRASLVQLVSQADELLREHPTCPAVAALQRFSLQLRRLTTTKFLSKKWFSRHFVLSNGYLHYADGDNGFPDSREGTLSFVRSNPSPSRRNCLDLKGCAVAACSAAVDGEAFAFEIKFPADRPAHKDVFLAAADDVTRRRCVRIIEAASAGGASSSLPDIASSAALTRGLLDMKSLAAVKAVLAALGVAIDHPSLKDVGYDPPSLKAAGFDVAAFRAAGCDWSTIRTAGFSAAQVKAAGCDPASAFAVGYDPPSLKAAGFDVAAFRAAGCDWSTIRTAGFSAAQVKAAGCDPASAFAVGYDPPSLKAAGFDVAAFRAAGCDWSTIRTAGFSAAQVKAAGCDPASAFAAGYDVLSLVAAYGFDAVKAAGLDVSCILVSFLMCSYTRALELTPPPPPPPPTYSLSAMAPTYT
jgi:hypothetical protein